MSASIENTALKLTAKAIVDTIEKHGNQAILSTSYGGWSHAGIMRPNVMQGKFFNMIGGCTNTVGDWSGGASQISSCPMSSATWRSIRPRPLGK